MSRILAIETSLRNGSVALTLDGNVIASKVLPSDMRSAQSLAPAVKEILSDHGWKPTELNGVGVTIGPGSFTGVRVGVTFAKVFCYVVHAPVIGLTTLEVLAHQAATADGVLDVVLDAQRADLFHQRFQISSQAATPITEPRLVASESWLKEHAEVANLSVTGAGLAKIRSALPRNVRVCDKRLWEPSADAVAALTHRAIASRRRDDVAQLAPLYLRASAAEEKKAGG